MTAAASRTHATDHPIPPTQAPARLIVVDDHAIVREGLRVILESDPHLRVVAESGDGICALALAQTHRPDLMLLDLRMPGMDGVEVMRQLRRTLPEQRVLIVTTYDTDEDIYNCMQAGACGYLLKDCPRQVIIEAVHEVLAGRIYVPPAISGKLVIRLSQSSLTLREQEVLSRMAMGYSNKEISNSLGISEGTIKTHAKHINEKLGAQSRTEAIALGRQRGYLNS